MKLRLLAMATVAAAALSTPALAGDGWYLGQRVAAMTNQSSAQRRLRPPKLRRHSAVHPRQRQRHRCSFPSGLSAWADTGWRLENEFAFTQHDLSATTVAGAATGGDQITSDMVNLAYDIPLGDTWKLTLGGGAGIGGFKGSLRTNGTAFDVFRGGQSGFQWQLIAGLSVAIAPDVDLFGEYRYRENEVDSNIASSYTNLTPIHISSVSRMWAWSACAGT